MNSFYELSINSSHNGRINLHHFATCCCNPRGIVEMCVNCAPTTDFIAKQRRFYIFSLVFFLPYQLQLRWFIFAIDSDAYSHKNIEKYRKLPIFQEIFCYNYFTRLYFAANALVNNWKSISIAWPHITIKVEYYGFTNHYRNSHSERGSRVFSAQLKDDTPQIVMQKTEWTRARRLKLWTENWFNLFAATLSFD